MPLMERRRKRASRIVPAAPRAILTRFPLSPPHSGNASAALAAMGLPEIPTKGSAAAAATTPFLMDPGKQTIDQSHGVSAHAAARGRLLRLVSASHALSLTPRHTRIIIHTYTQRGCGRWASTGRCWWTWASRTRRRCPTRPSSPWPTSSNAVRKRCGCVPGSAWRAVHTYTHGHSLTRPPSSFCLAVSAGARRKDPSAPKRPLSAYNIFFRDKKNELAAHQQQQAGGPMGGGAGGGKSKTFEELGRCVCACAHGACLCRADGVSGVGSS